MPRQDLEIVYQSMPDLDTLTDGITIETTKLEDGTYQAKTPNFPMLNPTVGPSPLEARQCFDRRLYAYISAEMNAAKANAADCSLTSRDPLTRG